LIDQSSMGAVDCADETNEDLQIGIVGFGFGDGQPDLVQAVLRRRPTCAVRPRLNDLSNAAASRRIPSGW